MGPTLNGLQGDGQFREVQYHYNNIVWAIIWNRSKVIDIYTSG